MASNNSPYSLAIPIGNGLVFVSEKDILYCTADGSYTVIHTCNQESLIIAKNLSKVHSSLSENAFVRIHNSHIINLQYTLGYRTTDKGRPMVTMSDGLQLPVSRKRKDNFLKRFKRM